MNKWKQQSNSRYFFFFGRGKKKKSMVVILASTYQLSPTSKTTWLIPLQGDNQLCKIVVHQEQQNSKMSSALWFLWRRFSSCQDSRGCRQLLTTQYRQPPQKNPPPLRLEAIKVNRWRDEKWSVCPSVHKGARKFEFCRRRPLSYLLSMGRCLKAGLHQDSRPDPAYTLISICGAG